MKRYLRWFGLAVILLLCALIPLFVSSPFYMDLIIVVIVNAILAITFIMALKTGLINMALVAFWGIGAYASAVLVSKLHLNFWLSLPASGLISAVFALGLGLILIGTASGGFSFVVLSSVIGMLFSVAVGNISYLGGNGGFPNIPAPNSIRISSLLDIEFNSKVPYFYLALFLLIIVILISSAFYASRPGRAWTAIGLNPRLAESFGVDIKGYKLQAFVLASFICGLVGSFYAHYEGFLQPSSFAMWTNIDIQAYAVLGGLGYAFSGPIIGSLIMTLLPQFLSNAALLAPLINGAVLILMIMFAPRGFLGLLERRFRVKEGVREKAQTASQGESTISSNYSGSGEK